MFRQEGSEGSPGTIGAASPSTWWIELPTFGEFGLVFCPEPITAWADSECHGSTPLWNACLWISSQGTCGHCLDVGEAGQEKYGLDGSDRFTYFCDFGQRWQRDLWISRASRDCVVIRLFCIVPWAIAGCFGKQPLPWLHCSEQHTRSCNLCLVTCTCPLQGSASVRDDFTAFPEATLEETWNTNGFGKLSMKTCLRSAFRPKDHGSHRTCSMFLWAHHGTWRKTGSKHRLVMYAVDSGTLTIDATSGCIGQPLVGWLTCTASWMVSWLHASASMSWTPSGTRSSEAWCFSEHLGGEPFIDGRSSWWLQRDHWKSPIFCRGRVACWSRPARWFRLLVVAAYLWHWRNVTSCSHGAEPRALRGSKGFEKISSKSILYFSHQNWRKWAQRHFCCRKWSQGWTSGQSLDFTSAATSCETRWSILMRRVSAVGKALWWDPKRWLCELTQWCRGERSSVRYRYALLIMHRGAMSVSPAFPWDPTRSLMG